jgi:hypothetical protein
MLYIEGAASRFGRDRRVRRLRENSDRRAKPRARHRSDLFEGARLEMTDGRMERGAGMNEIEIFNQAMVRAIMLALSGRKCARCQTTYANHWDADHLFFERPGDAPIEESN